MTEEQLQAIRERLDLLTFDSAYVKGDPWKGYGVYNEHNALLIAELSNLHEAEFLAESRKDVPALLAEVGRLKSQLNELSEVVRKNCKRHSAPYTLAEAIEWGNANAR